MFTYLARENMALIISALMAGLFAVAGTVWGLWAQSMVILFDGAYSLISLGLSLLSLYAARIIRRPANSRYPFGLGAVEPLVIAVKGLVIAIVCLFSLLSALVGLVQGGRPIDVDMAIGFGAISFVGCAIVWGYLRWATARNDSGLVQAEQRQWLMDSALSAAVTFGFVLAWLLEQTAWAHYAVYADPAMMVLISVYFIAVPVKMVLGAVRELLLAAPQAEQLPEIHETLQELGLNPRKVKVVKLGPNLLLEARLVRA